MSSPDLLPAAARGLWTSLPCLLAGSIAVTAGVLVPLLLAGGPTPLGVLLLAPTAGPVWAALVATAEEVVLGERADVRFWARALRRHAGDGVRVLGPPAAAAALAVAAWDLYRLSDAAWLLGPLAVSCTVTGLLALTTVAAVPLRTGLGLRGRVLWWRAAVVVGGGPAVALGTLALAGLGVLASTSLLASLLPLVPAPAALATVAGVWTTAGRLGLPLPTRPTGALRATDPSTP